jgi:diacylglycerol kinase family enzyme
MAGVIFVNPKSGADETSPEELRERFPGHRVEECEPARLTARIREALADGAEFIGAAGGDGTIRLAAEVLVGQEVPLLPIPAGTRNHFARDVGVEDLDAAAKAVAGRIIEIDVGRVNGRHFVNNSSIGLYPKVVVRREVHQRHVRKGLANIVAAYEQIRAGERVTIEIDGVTHLVWMVFVGNGEYGEGLLDLADRESLDRNILDLRVVRGDRPLSRLRIVGALLLGRLARSPLVLRERRAAITVRPRRTEVEVALDGEVEVLKTPLKYESVPHALKVLVPD